MLAAVATVGAVLPVASLGLAGTAVAAPACTPLTGLVSSDALTATPTTDAADGLPSLKDPVLSWSPQAGATGYQVQVSSSKDFSSAIVVDASIVPTSYAIPTSILLAHGAWFWRARAAGGCWSDDGGASPAQFHHGWDACPQLLTPLQGASSTSCQSGTYNSSGVATVALNALNFSWKPIADASYYEVEVSDSPDFPDPSTVQSVNGGTLSCFTSGTSFAPYNAVNEDGKILELERLPVNVVKPCFSPDDLQTGVAYYWRVRGMDDTKIVANGLPYLKVLVSSYHYSPVDATPGTVAVTSVNPRAAGIGTTVDITGRGFTPTTSVAFGETGAAVTYISSTELQARVPDPRTTSAPTLPTEPVNVLATTGSVTSVASSRDLFSYTGTLPGTGGTGVVLANTEVGSWSPSAEFALAAPGAQGDYTTIAAPTGLTATANGADCTTGCTTSPKLSWNAVTGASAYRVYVSLDSQLSSIVRTYETPETTLTPRDQFLDSAAGRAYYYRVEPCTDDGCGTLAAVASFAKTSAPVPAASVRVASPTNASGVPFAWQDQLTGGGTEAAQYHLQVATDCSFTAPLDDATVDAIRYVSPTQLFADGTYYWRIQTMDESGNPGPWTPGPNGGTSGCGAGTFTVDRTPPTASVAAGPGGTLVVTWSEHVNNLAPGQIAMTTGAGTPLGTGTYSVGPVSYANPAAPSVVITPTRGSLAPGQVYTVYVGGVVTDDAGNVEAMPGALAATTFTAPAAPVPNATAAGSSLTVSYSGPVSNLNPALFHLVDTTLHTDIASVATVSGQTVRIVTAQQLVTRHVYEARVDGGVLDGTGLVPASFGTIAGTFAAPFPPGVTTARNSDGSFTLKVDQDVTGLTTGRVHLLTGSTGAAVPTSGSVSGNSVTLVPTVGLVPGESYQLSLDSGVVGLTLVPVPAGVAGLPFRQATVVDGPSLSRIGTWSDRVAKGAYNGKALVNVGRGSEAISTLFRSSSATVYYCQGPMNGYLQVLVDGKRVQNVNTFLPFTRCGRTVAVKGLDGSHQHTLKLLVSGKKVPGKVVNGTHVAIDEVTFA